MTVLRYSADIRSPFRIEIKMRPQWQDTLIRWDGRVVCESGTKEELQASISITRDDGETLDVFLPDKLLPLPEVQIDGVTYKITVRNHRQTVKNVKFVLLFLAILNLGVALYAATEPSDFLQRFGDSTYYIIYGVVFIGLFIWARRNASWPIAIGAILYGFDVASGVANVHLSGESLSAAKVLFRLVFVAFLVRGYFAAISIRNRYLPHEPA